MPRSTLKVITLSLLLSSPAFAHGDAEWIMNSPEFGWCCGPQDCAPIPNNFVRRVADGWHVYHGNHIYVVLDGQEFPSIDDRYWLCLNGMGTPRQKDGKICLFVPRMGV